MKPLSNDLRQRILAAVDNREGSRRQLAARSSVNVSTITRLLQLRRQTGSFDPRPHGGGTPPTPHQDRPARLPGLVQENPRANPENPQQHMGVACSTLISFRRVQNLQINRQKKNQ